MKSRSIFTILCLPIVRRELCNAFLVQPTTLLVSRQATISQSLSRASPLFMSNDVDDINGSSDSIVSKGLTLALWSLPFDALLIHFSGWNHFLSSLSQMKANTTPEEFGSALQFWLLGTLSHPIMDAAFGISEIMHASPGPRLAGLVPFSFLATSGLVGLALWQWDKLRLLAISVVVSVFLAYVGSGLDGTSNSLLTDYNIQFDDDYQGQVFKGCPSPEAVQSAAIRQAFDYQKYQGRWYWHKVHDWTQFHQMYDTTLDIQLTANGYINFLSVKGPSPSSSPLSWDKSPILDGIRYSWQGTIDPSAGHGVSTESGFGVTFPNYIIDAQTINDDGPYQELVQFQCIEAGGVRIYEGIDFMSRSPTMSNDQLEAMHQRAVSINPYGAAPEQMHRIEQQQYDGNSIPQNAWQDLWGTLGIERYLDQSLKD